MSAFHYAKDSNGKARFGFFRPEYSGSFGGVLEVVHEIRRSMF